MVKRKGKPGSSAASVSAEMRDLLMLLPGYDPHAQAGGCEFNEDAAQAALDFFPSRLKHVEGEMAGKPFVLEDWQRSFVANLFGWKKTDGKGREVRRFREAFLFVARKNGKTPLVAGLALLVFFMDGEMGQQDYIAAGDREQAGLLFRQAKGMVEQEAELEANCSIYGGSSAAGAGRSIVCEQLNSYLRVISAEAYRKHGGNPHVVIVDELHVQPNRDLVDVLQTSMASENRKQSLFISLTTAGHDRNTICYEKYRHACRVRDNGGDESKPGYDPSFLPVIYETPREADWTSEESWKLANPNLSVSVSLDFLKRECKRAQETPDYENTFRQLHLNQWTEQATRWLQMAAWEKCGYGVDPVVWRREALERLGGRTCFGALDLASTSDLTAFVLIFPEEESGYTLLPWFWVPAATVEKRRRADGVRYDTWVRQGFIKATDGDWCDYRIVAADLLELRDQFDIQVTVFDPKEASMLAQNLIDAGMTMEKFVQCFTNYNEPVKLFEQLVNEGKIYHGNNPPLAWNAANVALDRNIAGLRLPSKKKSGEKIDGIVAGLMALGKAMVSPDLSGGGMEMW